ncbi:DUF937 domain-containing protein [Marilutibacter chinensis]|uniref:DUF937 domain-containing protein n=1 Tax=Marilutibacter chinensis TaxID=2912247 RepID=A0ABS9HQZ5_9GAMM|nr:DUF937 domain-containing protein [Lysobacter chinensis]MCF7221063.1 DUF937 domain-containing protein [Lysobacter chinensis]
MTASLTDDLFNQLQGQPLADMGHRLGLSQSQTAGAVSAALPLLLGALGRNTSRPQGADALFGALQRDHAGLDLGSVLGSVLGGGGQGAGILEHVLGGRQANAQRGLGAATGLDEGQAGALLKMLAPIVMAYLAKRMFAQPSSTSAAPALTPQGLGDILGQEQTQIRQQGGLGGGLLGAVLDQDGDGDLDINDLMRLGGSIFGSR